MQNNYDDNGSTSATLPSTTVINMRDHLAESNYTLVEQLAKRNQELFGRSYKVSANDMRSAGNQALAEALNSFDPTQGAPFTAYARTAIQNSMHNELRRLLPVDPKTAWNNGEGFSYMAVGDDSILNPAEGQNPDLKKLNEIHSWLSNWEEEEQYLKDRLRSMLKHLNPTDRDLIFNRFGFNGKQMTLKQLSAKYNISIQAVAKRERRILEKLRAALEGDHPYNKCA